MSPHHSKEAGTRTGAVRRRRRRNLLLGLGFLLLIAPWPIDSTHFRGRPFTRETERALLRAAQAMPRGSGPGSLSAGYAEQDITAQAGDPLAGFAARRGRCGGPHDRQRAQALALSDGPR